MVEEGLTLTVIVGTVPLKAVPSDKVPEIVPLPVTAKVKLVDEPLQIVAVPLNAPVGLALTVTAVAADEALWHPAALVTWTV
jgi:hypothetical protein